jgi:hypothetical protein
MVISRLSNREIVTVWDLCQVRIAVAHLSAKRGHKLGMTLLLKNTCN